MFNINDDVMYGNVGVCHIEGILNGKDIGMNVDKEYYKLYSYGEKEVIYTPTDTNVFMRKIMTKEQIKELIHKIPSLKTIKMQSKNIKVQSDYYKTFLKNCDSENMLMLIKTIYEKNLDRKKEGKKEGTIESLFLKEAQEKLYLEIAIAFGVEIDEVPKIIENELKNMQ